MLAPFDGITLFSLTKGVPPINSKLLTNLDLTISTLGNRHANPLYLEWPLVRQKIKANKREL
jgi:hypothetical protein